MLWVGGVSPISCIVLTLWYKVEKLKLPVWNSDMGEMAHPAGISALALPSVTKLILMMLQAGCAPGCGIWCVWPVCTYTRAAMVSNRHTQLDCNGYFYTVENDTHTHTSFKRTHLARQTFHTNKRALWTWHHTASLSAGKSIWTSSRPSTPPWPRLKPTLSTCCQMPLSKSKRMWLELDGCGFLRFPCRSHVVMKMRTHCHNTWCLFVFKILLDIHNVDFRNKNQFRSQQIRLGGKPRHLKKWQWRHKFYPNWRSPHVIGRLSLMTVLSYLFSLQQMWKMSSYFQSVITNVRFPVISDEVRLLT